MVTTDLIPKKTMPNNVADLLQGDPKIKIIENGHGTTASSTGAASEESPAAATGEVVTKRPDYLIWWDYFMSIAAITSMRSKDPNTQVGACIVNEDNRIVGVGYNGMPNGCSDDELPWARAHPDPLQTKYPYVCHAEMNAIMNKISYDLVGCTFFVVLFPCNECAKMIIQAKIRRVVYISDKYRDVPAFVASRRLLEMAGVELIQYTPKRKQIVIDFEAILS